MKRRALQVIVFLLLGAIVNVAVAWGCSLWSSLPANATLFVANDDDAGLWQAKPEIAPITEASWVWELQGTGCRYRILEGLHKAKVGASILEFVNTPSDRAMVVFAGIPTEAIRGIRWDLNTPPLPGNAFLQTPADGHSHATTVYAPLAAGPYRVVGWTPIWPGFAINTVFYAVIPWGLFALPAALRRKRRLQRGLCPKCAYPVATSDVCTECGAAVTVKPQRGASTSTQGDALGIDHTPQHRPPSPEGAIQSRALDRPFRAHSIVGHHEPRALPWAGMECTFGAYKRNGKGERGW